MAVTRTGYKTVEHLFGAYLHQDWTIDGHSLEEVFANAEALQELSPEIHREVTAMLQEEPTNQELEGLFFGQWQTGYEPEDPEGEDWIGVLHNLLEICETYRGDRD